MEEKQSLRKYHRRVRWLSLAESILFVFLGFYSEFFEGSTIIKGLFVCIGLVVLAKIALPTLTKGISLLRDGFLTAVVLLFPLFSLFFIATLSILFVDSLLWEYVLLAVLFWLLAFGEPKLHQAITSKRSVA